MSWITSTSAPGAVLIIRLMVGVVFMSEGTQKFLFPAEVGAGRFEKIGFPAPEIVAPLVGCFEIAGGLLVALGLLTRLAAIPLVVIMLTAIAVTKIPLLLDHGFWKMAHEARTDWALLLCLIFLLIVGAGRASIDAAWLNVPQQMIHSD